uniref:HTH araC/xylS-type domain-containing protein n=1 Tax=uncultured bacterium Contig1578 TaxID=1393460 RepID=W0FQB2_9BACT|nr:hypothetical protein [uncultured bacterium Contig1578]
MIDIGEFIRSEKARRENEARSMPLQLEEYAKQSVAKMGYWHAWFPLSNYMLSLHIPSDEFDRGRYYHTHLYYELVYVLRGSFINNTPEGDFLLTQGDVMLLDPRARHAPYTPEEDDIVFNFMLPIPDMQKAFPLFQKDSPLLYSFLAGYFFHIDAMPDILVFHTRDDPIIRHLFEALILSTINADARPEFPHAYLAILFDSLKRFHTFREDEVFPTRMFDEIPQILTYISQSIRTASLQDIAHDLGYTPNYLSRLIKQQTGKTFSRLVLESRLQMVCMLLETSDKSLQAICDEAGFYDVSNLCKAFKREYGTTPVTYRQNISLNPVATKRKRS